ncbi:MAG: universal stress protein [Algicola sp.]|nr:universal stress protein [Algicola sp.]
MKKHILLPTDFSDNAWSAIVYALKLFKDESCTIYFLHAANLHLSAMSTSSNTHLKTILDNAVTELLELKSMAETVNCNANHQFEIITSKDQLLEAIEMAVKTYQIDLVIMGTKGATGAQEFFFGSHTVHVLTHLNDCPILVVPDEFDFVPPKQLAFPTDYKHFFGAQELNHLKQFAALYDSKIRVVCILEDGTLTELEAYNKSQLDNYLMNYDHSFHFMPKYSKKTKEINDFIKALDIDLLVIFRYKHNMIERILKEPVIKKIGFQPLIPFLVIPNAPTKQ